MTGMKPKDAIKLGIVKLQSWTNVTLLQSPISLHSMFINERLTQRETGFFIKEPTIATLQQ